MQRKGHGLAERTRRLARDTLTVCSRISSIKRQEEAAKVFVQVLLEFSWTEQLKMLGRNFYNRIRVM